MSHATFHAKQVVEAFRPCVVRSKVKSEDVTQCAAGEGKGLLSL